ncbi:MAG: hypothetical protein JXQ90_08990 [Cyclobacteriaceae bacterium]
MSRWIFYPALLFKLFCGIGLGYVYLTIYQGGDTTHYFKEAADYFGSVKSPLHYFINLFSNNNFLTAQSPSAAFFIKLSAPLVRLAGYDYWIAGLYISFISFIGFWVLARVLIRYHPSYQSAIVFSLLFLPSVVFWNSGFLKDGLIGGAVAYTLCLGYRFFKGERLGWVELTMGVVFCYLLFSLRYQALFFAAIVGLFLLFARWRPFAENYRNVLLYVAFSALVIISASISNPFFSLERIPLTIVETYQAFDVKDFTYDLEPDYFSLLLNSPMALVNGLFRPFPWESPDWIALTIKIENIVLMFFLGWTFWQVRKWKLNFAIIAIIVFVIGSAILTGLTTPNFGSLSRYKVLYWPYFSLLVTAMPFRYIFAKINIPIFQK